MTIDKAKLKVLAEAATPGRHYDRLESSGGGIKYECTGDDGSLVLKVDHKNDEFGFVGDRGEADEAFFLACSPATILALLAEIERHEAWRTAFLAERDAQMRQRDQLRAENEALRKALLEASEEVATWGAYASEYFQEKHDLAGCVAKLHAAAMAKEADQ